MTGVVAGEEELGIQKRCPKCLEWLPLDGEFWYYQQRKPRNGRAGGSVDVMAYCRACWQERLAERHAARRRVA